MPARSVDEWLESIKYGYGRRYVSFFDELGVEDEDDIRRMKDGRVEELRRLLERSGIKAVQMDYLTEAVDEIRGAGRGFEATQQYLETRLTDEGFVTEARSGPGPSGLRSGPLGGARPASASPSPGRRDDSEVGGRPRPAAASRPSSASARPKQAAPQTPKAAMPNYEVEDRALVSASSSSRPRSAPASQASRAREGKASRSLILPQPPAGRSYWATPASPDLPVKIRVEIKIFKIRSTSPNSNQIS